MTTKQLKQELNRSKKSIVDHLDFPETLRRAPVKTKMSNNLTSKLQKLDEKLSYQCYRSVPKTKKWKSALKALELSCHGIGWLTITLILIYSNPENKPYSYLLGGLLIDIVIVALGNSYLNLI